MGRRPEGDDCSAELLCYLVLGAAARNGDESLLRPKVHFFLRGLDEMVVALNGTPDEVVPKLYLSLHDAKEGEGGGRHDDSFLPVLTCRNCGQHFFERHYQDLDFTYGSGNRIRGFENGDAVVDAKGNDNAVWSTAPAAAGTRLLMSNRLLEDAGDTSTGRSAKWLRAYLRGQGIELVNLGEAGRVGRGEIGHWICSVCGATKSPYSVDAEITHFLTTHAESCGKEPKRLAAMSRGASTGRSPEFDFSCRLAHFFRPGVFLDRGPTESLESHKEKGPSRRVDRGGYGTTFTRFPKKFFNSFLFRSSYPAKVVAPNVARRVSLD